MGGLGGGDLVTVSPKHHRSSACPAQPVISARRGRNGVTLIQCVHREIMTCTHVNAHASVCTHTYKQVHTQAHMTCIHVHIQVCVHTHTHTHTLKKKKVFWINFDFAAANLFTGLIHWESRACIIGQGGVCSPLSPLMLQASSMEVHLGWVAALLGNPPVPLVPQPHPTLHSCAGHQNFFYHPDFPQLNRNPISNASWFSSLCSYLCC